LLEGVNSYSVRVKQGIESNTCMLFWFVEKLKPKKKKKKKKQKKKKKKKKTHHSLSGGSQEKINNDSKLN